MQVHEKFGKPILQYKTKNIKVYFIIAGLIILIIGAFIVAGSMFFDPAFYRFAPNDPIGKYLPAGIVVLCLIWVFIIFPRLPKALQTEGTLYEKGIVLSLQRGMGQFTRDLECSFDEIKGIKHFVVRYYVNGIIPSGKNLAFFVCMKQQYQAYTGNNRIKSYNLNRTNYDLTGLYPADFFEKLSELYINYLVKDLTRENITQAKIAFGADLELNNGLFVYNGGQVILPLNAVSRITSDKLPLMDGEINLRSINENEKEQKTISISVKDAMNVDALYYIINNLA